MSKSKLLLALIVLPSLSMAAPMADYSFKSPAFNGVGYSSHVLTIENQEHTRQKELRDQLQAALDKAAADKSNTNMSKFLSNLESRIYAQVSQNLAAQMFADGPGTPTSGSFVMAKNADGTPMTWMQWRKYTDSSNTTQIEMTVYQPGVPPTTISVPLDKWTF
jgi:hypothetical protein